MADLLEGRRPFVVAGALVAVVVLLTVARGSVALTAAATVALLAAAVVGVPPLLKPDGIDWDWRPGGADEVRVEPGIANLRRLLSPAKGDDEAAVRLHELVAALAADRAPLGPPRSGALADYLAAPPRRLSGAEADAVITELEQLSPKESS